MKNKKFDFMISKSKENDNKLIPVIISYDPVSYYEEFYDIDDSDLDLFVIYFGFIPLLHLDIVNYNSDRYNTRRYGIPFFKSKKINNEQNSSLNYKSYLNVKNKKQNFIFSDSLYDLYYDKNIYINKNFALNRKKIVRYDTLDMYHFFIPSTSNKEEKYEFVCKVPFILLNIVNIILKHINCDFSKIIDFIQYYIETSDSDYKKFFKDYEINNNGMVKYMKIYISYKTKIKYKIIRLDLLEMLFNKIINYYEFRYYYNPNYDNWI